MLDKMQTCTMEPKSFWINIRIMIFFSQVLTIKIIYWPTKDVEIAKRDIFKFKQHTKECWIILKGALSNISMYVQSTYFHCS